MRAHDEHSLVYSHATEHKHPALYTPFCTKSSSSDTTKTQSSSPTSVRLDNLSHGRVREDHVLGVNVPVEDRAEFLGLLVFHAAAAVGQKDVRDIVRPKRVQHTLCFRKCVAAAIESTIPLSVISEQYNKGESQRLLACQSLLLYSNCCPARFTHRIKTPSMSNAMPNDGPERWPVGAFDAAENARRKSDGT